MLTLLIATNAAARAGGSVVPPAPQRPFHQTYFGTDVSDPYHWMDAAPNPELTSWLEAQGQHSRQILDALPSAPAMRRRMTELSTASVEVRKVVQAGKRWFYLKREADGNSFRLCVREPLDGPERVLIDPDSASSEHHAIDFFVPSDDGKLIVYGLSAGGSEDSVLHVFDVDNARPFAEQIERARAAIPQWRHDGKAFFYRRHEVQPPGAPASLRNSGVRTWLHTLGTDPAKDIAVFGVGVSERVPIKPEDTAVLYTVGQGRYLLGAVRHGLAPDVQVFVAPASAPMSNLPWRQVAGFEDHIRQLDVHDNDIYFMSNRGSPHGEVVRASLQTGDFAHGKVVFPEGKLFVRHLAIAEDALYLGASDGGITKLLRVPFTHGKLSEVPLPFAGSIDEISSREETPGILFSMQSWTHPIAFFRYLPTTGLQNAGLLPPNHAAPNDLETEELKVPSSGGVQVPLSIVRRRGLARNGSHPVWLSAYGSYGIAYDSEFVPRRMAWLEQGGVFAVCHARGGGEYNEEWHQAATKEHKQNTIDDVVACARSLIERGYTSPQHLGVEGTSAGGLAAGGALAQHPELFGAAILRVPVVDPISFEGSAGGASNSKEFGTAKVQSELTAMLAYSPYHSVRDGVPYPAVLLTTGLNDGRVPASQAARMTARLQAASSSGKPILLRVAHDAGHGSNGATRTQTDDEMADIYSFMFWQLASPNATAPKH